MALKSVIGFAARLIGDGADKNIGIVIATAPIGLRIPSSGDAAYSLPPGFVLNTPTPSSVANVQSGNNHAIASCVLALGVLTITYEDALPDGEVDTVFGDLVFS